MEEELSAYHECGHALMAIYVGARVESLTIDPPNDDGPKRHADTRVHWPANLQSPPRDFHEKLILVALAGPVAEMIHERQPYHPGLVAEWAHDWRMAWKAAEPLIANGQKRLAYLENVTVELHRLFDRDDFWAALAALADNLIAHETLEEEQIYEYVEPWMRQLD